MPRGQQDIRSVDPHPLERVFVEETGEKNPQDVQGERTNKRIRKCAKCFCVTILPNFSMPIRCKPEKKKKGHPPEAC